MQTLILLSLLLTALSFASASTRHERRQGCESPAVRREWRQFSSVEKKNYIDAIRCLSHLPHKADLQPTGSSPGTQPVDNSSSLYDDFVYVHMDGVDTVHGTGRFFPWHRLFIQTFEDFLRLECGFTGYLPYWDWTLDAHDIKSSAIFDPDPETGFGAFPDEGSNFTVTTGGFRDLVRAYPSPHIIKRHYTLKPFSVPVVEFPFEFSDPDLEANSTQTLAEWDKMISSFQGNFTAFQAYVDGHRLEGVHTSTHTSVGGKGGDVANLATSPSDPMFYLLHANLDRLWALWQDYAPENKYAIGGGEVQDLVHIDDHLVGTGAPVTTDTILYLSNIAPDSTIGDMLDIGNGVLCYTYA